MADKKRKGLMEVLEEYRREQNSDGGTKGKGPVASGKTYGKTLKQNKKEDASGPKVLAPKKKAAPKAKPAAKKPAPKKEERVGQPAPYKLVKPTKMAPRKKRPGTGRTGEAAAKAANRKPSPPKKTMTAAERRKMRLRARRGR